MKEKVALIGNPPDLAWADVVRLAVQGFNWRPIELIAFRQLYEHPLGQGYHLVLIDSVAIADPEELVARLHRVHPKLLIIVVSASPTWRRARSTILAGAADYVRKSLDARELHNTIVEAMTRTSKDLTTGHSKHAG